jgi:hypothetical protein
MDTGFSYFDKLERRTEQDWEEELTSSFRTLTRTSFMILFTYPPISRCESFQDSMEHLALVLHYLTEFLSTPFVNCGAIEDGL